MGCYIDLADMPKEQWLAQNGVSIPMPHGWDFSSDTLPVCLVHNHAFTAAGICYDLAELRAFYPSSERNDFRLRAWFRVKRELLKPFLYRQYGGTRA
jgi:hypothetical protein